MINKYLEDKAEKLLKEHNHLSIGLDIIGLCKKLNVVVDKLDLDGDVSGFFALENGVAHIGYNKEHTIERKRFTIAHELGHYILHSKEKRLFIDKKKMYRNSNSTTGENYREIEANSFAAALLMPRVLIEKELSGDNEEITKTKIKKLAIKFKVSEQAMNIRLINLDYINYSS